MGLCFELHGNNFEAETDSRENAGFETVNSLQNKKRITFSQEFKPNTAQISDLFYCYRFQSKWEYM